MSDERSQGNSATAAILARQPRPFGALPIGTDCWYRLRFNGELIPARVIDTWTDDFNDPLKLMRPKTGCVHLEIFLDPERHHAADERGLRQNVTEGTANGQFLRERPADEDRRRGGQRALPKIPGELRASCGKPAGGIALSG